MAEYNDILIFGVRNNAQTPDTGFIVTPNEFGQMLGDDPGTLLDEIHSARAAFGDSVWAGFDKDGETYSVRMVKIVEDISKDIISTAAYMAKSISSYGDVPFAFPSQAARDELAKFLDSELRAVSPSYKSEKLSSQDERPDPHADFYNYNVGCIFQTCGLLHVERQRRSVTQGEAVVMVGNNFAMTHYGDDIYLPTPAELISLGSSPSEIAGTYGSIINGWVSRYSDAFLIQSALQQCPDLIRAAIRSENLLPPKTAVSLDSRISEARSRMNAAEQVPSKDLSR